VEALHGKVAFITGGASGIGLGIARACLDAGMRVAIADVRRDHLDEATALLAGQQVHAVELDVTDRAGFAGAADEAERTLGPVDLLVNNAGVGILGSLQDTRYDDWDWGLGVNLGGVINGLQTVVPRMRERGKGGHVVTTSSMAAVVPIPNAAIYITAKAAVMGLMESIRPELAAHGIGASILFPGPVKTNIRESGRLRPERFRRDSGLAERERNLQDRPDDPTWMDPLECGRRVLDGVRRDDLYILTHREFREGARERCDALIGSFPDEPVDSERAERIAFLTSNPMFGEIVGRAR
jgi:NAD(P)-dependent dehydrogenase (short-subunit alcohol dehydrogenase family)